MRFSFVVKLLLTCVFCLIQSLALAQTQSNVIFCGSTNNDLYKLLTINGFEVKHYSSPYLAITSASEGAPVFIVADGYPKRKNKVEYKALRLAKQKHLRLYIEYPASLPDLKIGNNVINHRLYRGIITSGKFGEMLSPMSIVGINDCYILPVKVNSSLIVLGKVAGFDKAVYGIKDVKTYPVLFKKNNEIVAMTKLSNFATGRYSPGRSWKEIWEYIISWMIRNDDFKLNYSISYVSPMYGKNDNLPRHVAETAVSKGVKWYYKANLFVDSSWKDTYLKYQGNGTNPVGPPVSQDMPNGNGTLGILEGQASIINYNGTQKYRYWIRADVQGGGAYALSAAADFLHKPKYNEIASNLINFVFHYSNLRSGKKDNKNSSVYGLIGWAVTHPGVFYGDDNARCLLGVIGASAYLNTNRWDQEILEGILANFRTTGEKGFRGNRLEAEDILKNGWRYYWNRNIVNPSPHFEAWMWACYLWLYDKTGYKPLLEKTEEAIRVTMKAYPDQWEWTNGFQEALARMILPLAWLVRIDDTREHRQWLDRIVSDLLANQVDCGAIRAELGTGKGLYGRTPSNEAYGKREAPLIFENGDPIADMLYTNNFALFSLNEAAHATGNKKYYRAVHKLANFLLRIQVKSNKFESLDGAWFRAFDYKLWDYWASNADAGWGAWATEAGWTQSWIITSEILVDRDQSYWELTKKTDINKYMDQTVDIMFKPNLN